MTTLFVCFALLAAVNVFLGCVVASLITYQDRHGTRLDDLEQWRADTSGPPDQPLPARTVLNRYRHEGEHRS